MRRAAANRSIGTRPCETFCDRFKAIQARARTRFGRVLSTGQIATEEMALLGALAKFGMGMVHGDGNTRQCMATAVVGLQAVVRLRRSALHLRRPRRIGRDRVRRLRICASRIRFSGTGLPQSRIDPQIIVVDPRKTETAMAATLHLPIQPKSDLASLLWPGPHPRSARAGSTATTSLPTPRASRSSPAS